MEIEKARGISVTSTVLSFEYRLNQNQFHLNLLDTPGHQDFSEDTYRQANLIIIEDVVYYCIYFLLDPR